MKTMYVVLSPKGRRAGLEVEWLREIYSVTYLLTGKQRGPLG